MRCRWLLAIFALHFFLSVGAFAFGKVPSHEMMAAQAPGLVSASAHTATPSAPSPASPETGLGALQAADHALNDGQADLPECLDVPIATSTRSAPLRAPSPPLAKDLTPPVLDGPQRPPRGALAIA